MCAILGAREFDQQYEWTRHEAAGLQFGVSQKVADTIKFNRPLVGLPEDETAVIQMAARSCAITSSTRNSMRTRSSGSVGKARWRWPSI